MSINYVHIFYLQLMIDIVARIFFIRNKLVDDERKDETVRNHWSMKMASDQSSNIADDRGVRVRLLADRKDDCYRHDIYENGQPNGDIDIQFPLKTGLAEDIRIIREILEKYREQQKKGEIKEKYIREWKVICCITDRLFFLFYLIINIVGVAVIFFLD